MEVGRDELQTGAEEVEAKITKRRKNLGKNIGK